MKKIINSFVTTLILILFVFFSNIGFGQYQHSPDLFDPELSENAEILNNSNYDFVADNTEPVVLNVYFYGLTLSDTSIMGWDGGSMRLTEEKALEKIADLNIAFNPFNIFFKYRGFELYSEIVEDGPLEGRELAHLYHFPGVNLEYMLQRISEISSDENSICIVLHDPDHCFPRYGNASVDDKIVLASYCKFHKTYIIHQMAHLLGLLNTQTGTSPSGDAGPDPDPNVDTIPQEPLCDDPDAYYPSPYEGGGYAFLPKFEDSFFTPENVTRDETNIYYNADIAGDRVKDTPAAFWGSRDNKCHSATAPFSYDFLAQDGVEDNSPEHLMYENIDLLNIMQFGYNQYRTNFTNGQGVRMRETIEIDGLHFDEVMTDVESLYEPYKQVFDVDCETNNETLDYLYANTPENDPRDIKLDSGITFRAIDDDAPIKGCTISYFQPGFDYEIYRCRLTSLEGDTEMGDLLFTYDTNPNLIPMFNWGGKQIRIVQLDEYGECHLPFFDNLTAVSGSVFSHDGDYDVVPKDEEEINDGEFLNDLPIGIHTINIQTNKGETIQKTIQKIDD